MHPVGHQCIVPSNPGCPWCVRMLATIGRVNAIRKTLSIPVPALCYAPPHPTHISPPPLAGPIPRSVTDFWRLVWQEKPPTIVMVTNLEEGNKNKCVQYWPDSGSTTFGPFKVTLTEHQVFADYCIRTMQVSVSMPRELSVKLLG